MTNPNGFPFSFNDSSNPNEMNRGRIGTSATEIELFDEIPSLVQAERNPTDKFSSIQQTANCSFQSASFENRQKPSEHNFDDAVENLLRKYAPDALPKNLVTTATERQPISTNNTLSTLNNVYSTIGPSQKNDSHVYSTIDRSSRDPTSTSNQPERSFDEIARVLPNSTFQAKSNPAYDNFNHTLQTSQQTRLTSNNFSPNSVFQPPANASSRQKPPAKPSRSKPASSGQTTKTTHIIDGQWDSSNQDPLDIFFERQNPPSTTKQKTAEPVVEKKNFSTFQPSVPSTQQPDPLNMILTSYASSYSPEQITTQQATSLNQEAQFNLTSLIQNIQQDYLRQIQPFVASVKFIEKDQTYGQNLNDINFVTPVSVRKGFLNQAEDLLKQNFGHTVVNKENEPTSSTVNSNVGVSNLESGAQTAVPKQSLGKSDSQKTISSLTSVSSTNSDFDYSDEYSDDDVSNAPDKANKVKSAVMAETREKSSQTENSQKPTETSIYSTKPVTKATRVPSDELSPTTSDSSSSRIDDVGTNKSLQRTLAQYNEHEETTSKSKDPTNSGTNGIYQTPRIIIDLDETKSKQNGNNQSISSSTTDGPRSKPVINLQDSDDKTHVEQSNQKGTVVSQNNEAVASKATVNAGRFVTEESKSSTITNQPSAPTSNASRFVTEQPTAPTQPRSPPVASTNTKNTASSVYGIGTDTPPIAFKNIQETPMLLSRNNRDSPSTHAKTTEHTPFTTTRTSVNEPSGSDRLFRHNARVPSESSGSPSSSKSFRHPWKSMKSFFRRS